MGNSYDAFLLLFFGIAGILCFLAVVSWMITYKSEMRSRQEFTEGIKKILGRMREISMSTFDDCVQYTKLHRRMNQECSILFFHLPDSIRESLFKEIEFDHDIDCQNQSEDDIEWQSTSSKNVFYKPRNSVSGVDAEKYSLHQWVIFLKRGDILPGGVLGKDEIFNSFRKNQQEVINGLEAVLAFMKKNRK